MPEHVLHFFYAVEELLNAGDTQPHSAARVVSDVENSAVLDGPEASASN